MEPDEMQMLREELATVKEDYILLEHEHKSLQQAHLILKAQHKRIQFQRRVVGVLGEGWFLLNQPVILIVIVLVGWLVWRR